MQTDENTPKKKENTYSLGVIIFFGIVSIPLLAILVSVIISIIPFVAFVAPFYFYFDYRKTKINLIKNKDYQEYLYNIKKLEKKHVTIPTTSN